VNNTKEKCVIVHVDGACSGNPGFGGWAYVIKYNDVTVAMAGREDTTTTNSRMELTAALKALNRCIKILSIKDRDINTPIHIHSDSRYVVNIMNGMFKKINVNNDLVLDIRAANKNANVTWIQVPRNSTEQMEVCDNLAKEASKKPEFKWEEKVI